MKKGIIIIALMLLSNIAAADCWYNGAMYPTGTKVAGLTCQADGSWK